MGAFRIVTVALAAEPDVLSARQRARRLTAELGFDTLSQTRFATAVSEVARNAYVYAGGGLVEFSLEGLPPRKLVARVADRGPGIADPDLVLSSAYRSATGMGVGLQGSRRLVEEFSLEPRLGGGLLVTLGQTLPPEVPTPDPTRLPALADDSAFSGEGPLDELRRQNGELLQVLDELRARQGELALVNRELEETNRGVVALHAELARSLEGEQEANRELEAFSYSISHDLRAPLRHLMSFPRILREDHADHLTPEMHRLLELIEGSARRMAQLVDDLLGFSLAARTSLVLVQVDMTALFREVWEQLAPVREGRTIRFDLPRLPRARGDQALLRQVLVNLVDNAIKFTRDAAAAEVRVTAVPEGELVRYALQDNGAGFDMRFRDRLFGVFQRLHREHQFEGTGVGLALVQRIVSRHGGRVAAEGAVGKGATFSFTLKAGDPP